MKKPKPSTSKEGNVSQNTAEVFVLPPDLLAKLGINLGNIQHSKVEPPAVTSPIKETEQSIDHSISHNLPDSENNSSILETANLMKVSVFLSPTFSQTLTAIPDDEQIAGDESVVNTNTIISSEHGSMSHHSNRNYVTRIHLPGKQNDSDLLQATSIMDYNTEIPMEQVVDFENCELIKNYKFESQDNYLTLTKIPYKNNKSDKMYRDKVVSLVDNHPDEAYQSDCSNNFCGVSLKSSNFEVNKQKISDKNMNIKIPNEVANENKQSNVVNFLSDAVLTPVITDSVFAESQCHSNLADKKKMQNIIVKSKVITRDDQPTIESIEVESNQNVFIQNKIAETIDMQKETDKKVPESNDDIKKATFICNGTNKKKLISLENNVIDSKILHDMSEQVSKDLLQENEKLLLITQSNSSCTQANDDEATYKNEENTVSSSENTHKNNNNITEIVTTEYKKTKSSEAIVIDSKILHDIDKQVSKEPPLENEKLVSITQFNFSCTQTNHSEASNKNEENAVNSSEDTCKNNNNKTEIDTQDRVTEIASYLSKIAKKRKKIKNKGKKVEKVVKVNPAIAKSCVQGVEKPGGKLVQDEKVELVRILKTYKRASIRQQIPRKLAVSETNTTLDAFQLINSIDQSDTEMNVTDVTLLARQNKFCICFDFGNLAYYDCEILYEHIHFWLHNNNECDIETLYSIYNQDYDILIQTVDFVEEDKIEIDTPTIQNTLCWNELNTPVNNDRTKSDISDSIFSTRMNSARKKTKTIPETEPVNCAKLTQNLIKSDKSSENTATVKANNVDSNVHMRPSRSKSSSYVTPKLPKKSSSDENEIVESSNLTKSTLKRKLSLITVVNDTELSKTSGSKDNAMYAKNTKLSNNEPIVSTDAIHNINNKTPKSTVKSKKNRVMKGKGIDEPTHGNSEKVNFKTTPSTYQNKDDSSPAKNIQTIKTQNIVSAKTMHNINNKTPKSTKVKSLQTNELAEGKDTKEQTARGNSNTINSDLTKVDVKSEQPFNIVTKIETELTNSYNRNHETTEYIKTPSYTETNDVLKCTKSKSNITPAESVFTKNSKGDRTLETLKSTKRPLSISVNQPAKKVKTMGSKSKYDPLNQHLSQDEGSHCRPSEVEMQITSEKTCSATKYKDVPDIEIKDSKISLNTLDTTNVDSTIPDDSKDITIEHSTSQDTTINKTITDVVTKCGVCAKSIKESKWEAHMWKQHDYLAWRDGEDPLNLEDEIEVKKHLQSIANRNNGLVCKRCNVKRKNAKTFLGHVKSCIHSNPSTSLASEVDEVMENDNLKDDYCITCGVCSESVQKFEWIEHIRTEHKYLAWTSEETPLNLDDEVEVKKHLNYISKQYGGLLCHNCNLRMCYVKKYFRHIETCEDCEFVAKNMTALTHKKVLLNLPAVVTCGVCKLEVKGKKWVRHIQMAHEYMAWIGGEQPFDTDNPEQVKEHLDAIVRVAGELICMKCGERRRYAHAYMQHRAACERTGFDMNLDATQTNSVDKGKFICGVCHEVGKLKEWQTHAMSKHYNIAWKAGEIPINLRNPYAVEKYLKKYKSKRGSLICLNCKESRVSCYGFYAHILTCGRTPEEIEGVMNDCEICHNKYLCIYRNQHMAAHKDSDMRRIKREEKSKKSKEEVLKEPEPSQIQPFGKRRAAVKANTVIKKHSSNMVDGKPVCSCGSIFQNKEEFEQHTCTERITDDGNESDVSVKIEQESGESEDDEYVDSAVSDEEEDLRLKKRYRVVESTNKLLRMSYKVENVLTYLTSAYREFAKLHYTSESLFNVWRNSEYQIVPAEEREAHLPLVAESCKIRFGNQLQDGWTTYKRFMAKKTPGYSFFTGGATQCIAWVPPNLVEESLANYLAVSVHRTADVPRHSATERPRFPASLQIWHLGQFQTKPYCALFIAHDFGIVWSMDWCPSGARDGSVPIVPHDCPEEKESTPLRLGLLAVACSNGSAYILAVPCPPTQDDIEEPPMYKLKPVAELKLTMTLERRVYQATSIKWSQQNGHSTIIVGYSDGTTALYDLNTESPFLMTTEGEITIYYPYQDKRSESSSITSVGLFTTTNKSYPNGGQWSTSMTGGTIINKDPRPSSRCHVAVSSALHAAHWPAVTLSGDIPFMRAVSEMEWWGGGRRAGAGRSWAACARCGRAASFAPPALRLHAHHPAHSEMKKVMAALLLMVPLVQKPKHSQNDELSVVLEPLTYDDTIDKYGLQLNMVLKNRGDQSLAHQISTENEFRPDRFPLSDIVAMAFCPSTKFHDRLALATHTGIVFILNTL